MQRARDLRAGGQEHMRASNLRAYARRDLARMRLRLESVDTSVSYSVLHLSRVTRHACGQVL